MDTLRYWKYPSVVPFWNYSVLHKNWKQNYQIAEPNITMTPAPCYQYYLAIISWK